MNLKTVLGWASVAFLVWFVIESPHGAATIDAHIGGFLTSAAHGISNFFGTI